MDKKQENITSDNEKDPNFDEHLLTAKEYLALYLYNDYSDDESGPVYEERNVLAKMVFKDKTLAETISGLERSDEFDGTIEIDGDIIRVSFSHTLPSRPFEVAYPDEEIQKKIFPIVGGGMDHLFKEGRLIEEIATWDVYRDGDYLGTETSKWYGNVGYSYYRGFVGVSDGSGEGPIIRKLWLGVEHDCADDELCIPMKLWKVGKIDLRALEEAVISADCEKIAAGAFEHSKKLRRLVVLSDKAKFPEDDIFASDDVVIAAHKGSSAEEYAKMYGIKFEII